MPVAGAADRRPESYRSTDLRSLYERRVHAVPLCPPVERVALPPFPSLTNEVQVVDDIEEITLPVPDRDADVVPIIH